MTVNPSSPNITRTCISCGAEIPEMVFRCPRCGFDPDQFSLMTLFGQDPGDLGVKLPDVQWIIEAWQEVLGAGDRAAIIVGAAYLDTKLQKLIDSYLIYVTDEKEKKAKKRLFQYNGPFGTFGGRIDSAFFLGLLSRNEFHNLDIIHNIRNTLAHNIDIASSCDSQSIRDRLRNLRMPKAVEESARSPRERFELTWLMLQFQLDLRMSKAEEERLTCGSEKEWKRLEDWTVQKIIEFYRRSRSTS